MLPNPAAEQLDPGDAVQVQAQEVSATGKVSATLLLAASSGPALPTVIV